jgi:N-acetylneuraminic acid mutarotase
MNRLTRRGFVAGTLAAGLARPAFGESSPWTQAAPLPVRTQEIYPAVLDGQIYLAGGLSPDAEITQGGMGILDRVFRWSPDRWEEVAPLPEPRHHPNLVGHDNAVYAIGGFRAGHGGAWNMLPATTRYDPAANSWNEVAPLPDPFAETCAVSLPSGIHVATGRQPAGEANADWTDHTDSGAHFVYDAGEDRWRRAAPNPHPRNSAAGAVLDGRFHVIGGRRVGEGNETHHEVYDPGRDTWHSLAPLPQGQAGLAAAVVQGRIYAFGGEYFDDQGGGVYPEVWVYDPESDRWDSGPPMRTPRHGLGGVAIGDRIFAIAGATGPSARGTSNGVEVYAPQP